MKKASSDKFLRIPIRYVDKKWECEYGGTVPVAPGAEAELVIASSSITDNEFLGRMKAQSSIKVLEEGVTLLAYLATKQKLQLTEEQKKYLLPWQDGGREIATEYIDNWSTGGLSLIEVSICEPTNQQAKKFNSVQGGLWLLTEGPKAVGLQSTRIRLPKIISEEPVNSLNHAFTKLSEVYEPWRISHTGNVYQRFLYKEKDSRWYPLDLLRSAALANKEQEIASQLWRDFMKRMSASGTESER